MELKKVLILLAFCAIYSKAVENDEIESYSDLPHECPPGFHHSAIGKSKCYSVVIDMLDWDSAQKRCRKLHPRAHLVVINSAEESQVIAEILEKKEYDCLGTIKAPNNQTFYKNNYWTSGRREENRCNSRFIWRPSKLFVQSYDYTNWCDSEPNCAFDQEHCMSITKFCYGLQWNDIMCSWPLCSICEVMKFEYRDD